MAKNVEKKKLQLSIAMLYELIFLIHKKADPSKAFVNIPNKVGKLHL